MADPANSRWKQMLSNRLHTTARRRPGAATPSSTSPTTRGDLRFGVRFTDREAVNRSPFTWNAITPYPDARMAHPGPTTCVTAV
jgi:hypothetical protein